MQDCVTTEAVFVSPTDLARVLDLYEQGLCIRAYAAAEAVGPLRRWIGPAAMIVAGRLAMNLGAPRFASGMHLRAGRSYPDDPEARYYYARALSYRRGPLASLKFMAKHGDLDGAEDFLRADWLAFRAILQGQLRDFSAAEKSLARAESTKPDWPWVILERAHLFEMEDRHDDALAAGRRALEVRPWYRPAVQAVAQTLQSLDRDIEALELLTEASERLESGPVVTQLAMLQTELGRVADAGQSWDRLVGLSPMLEKQGTQWLAGRRSDSSYEMGDLASAAAFARESKEPFFIKLAERLEKADPGARRVQLDVGFVRQHHQTCAPATLSAISRFWKMPADHLEVAEAICYDGTPDHRERSWAEGNGWHAREFTVGWEAAVSLLDAGIPFTLTTVEIVSAHLQAVIGYDARRGTLLIRDPSNRQVGEVFADGLIERYKSTGPRGMALVPVDLADRLDALKLPDAEPYDKLHKLQCALHRHDREAAARVFEIMESSDPDHRLTLQAGRILAIYDMDSTRLLSFIERLLVDYPDDQLLQMSKLSCLREHARRDDRLAMLRSICERPEADPVFRRQLASDLSLDARERPTVLRLLRRAIRTRPSDDVSLSILGNVLWDIREFDEATSLYRFASCLDDKDEGHARAYFIASRSLGRTTAALSFLEDRFRRHGKRSGQPGRTLFWAYSQRGQMREAFSLLEEAMCLRPDDGDLRLFAAEQHANHGEFDRAAEPLAEAKGKTRRAAWLRAAAALASAQGESPTALTLWTNVVAIEPTAIDAHRSIARLLAETSSREAAIAHVRDVCDRFPHNYPLHQLLIQWLRDDGPDAVEPSVRALVDANPADPWARRELALILSELRRFDDALSELEFAGRLEPSSGAFFNVKGQVLERAGRVDEAKDAYRAAIKISVDDDFALGLLIELAETRTERIEALALVESELANQVIFGDGLLAYQRLARQTLEADVLLQALEKGWKARPDLWHAWSAYIRQLDAMDRHGEAREVASRAVERFPLMPRLWMDLASTEGSVGRREAQIEALRVALKISPGWSAAVRQLAQVFEEGGQHDESRAVLEQAVARDPLDSLNHGWLADALWNLGEKDAAIERLQQAIRLEPRYDWAWNSLHRWAAELDRSHETEVLARELTTRRAGDPTVWLTLARNLQGPENLDERLAALERSILLHPRLTEAHDLRAELLAEAGRFDEARAASFPPVFGARTPLMLQGRAAWVEAQAGEMKAAVSQMRSALSEDPDYYWGWRQLSEWLLDGPAEELLEVTNHLIRLAPDSAPAYGYRGDARVRLKDPDGAKVDFARAIEILPDYEYACLSLFDLQFADGQYEEAVRTIDERRRGEPNPFSVARSIQAHTALGHQQPATSRLRELCLMPGAETWPFEASLRAFWEAGWLGVAEWSLRQVLPEPDLNPQAVRCWIECKASYADWNCLDRNGSLLQKEELADVAIESLLRELGKARAASPLKRFMKKHSGRIHDRTRLWGMAGYALTTVPRLNHAAIKFMSDWRERADVEPWMLSNLVIALRTSGQSSEAHEVSRHALTLPADFTTPYHRIWVSIEEAIGGRIDEATSTLGEVDPDHLDGTNRALFRIARFTIRIASANAEERRRRLGPMMYGLRRDLQLDEVSFEDRRAVRSTYRRVLASLRSRVGGPGAYLRASWDSLFVPRPLR